MDLPMALKGMALHTSQRTWTALLTSRVLHSYTFFQREHNTFSDNSVFDHRAFAYAHDECPASLPQDSRGVCSKDQLYLPLLMHNEAPSLRGVESLGGGLDVSS